MSSTVILKAAGLNTSPNELSVPEGSLSEATNVLIRRDGIIEQRRGFKLYGNPSGVPSDRVKQLSVYRNRIIRHINNTLQYDSNGSGLFQSFSGSFSEADSSLRMKFIESNGNLYFTSSNGIQKLSSKTTDTLSSSEIVSAGALKALDIIASVKTEANLQTGFLPQDSTVSYRVVWGYKDSNGNLILGSPSQREIIYCYQIDLMLQDFMRFLGVLDSFTNSPLTTARINDKNYVSLMGLTSGASTGNLRSNLISLASKIDNDILYADTGTAPITIVSVSITTGICTIVTSGVDPSLYLQAGDNIFLSGFSSTPITSTINGQQVITATTPTSISFNVPTTGSNIPTNPITISSPTITSGTLRMIAEPPAVQNPAVHIDNLDVQVYMTSIVSALRLLPDGVISTSDQLLLDTIIGTTSVNLNLTITIPQNINSSYFYQVYRSAIFSASNNVSITDVVPNDELQLVYEAYPTALEILAGELSIVDITPAAFAGANLYTNNSTGEGILQSNEIPPFALDINRYRNVVFYANTRTKHKTLLNLLGVQNMIADYNNSIIPSITISSSLGTNTYKFVTGLQETLDIITVADVSNSLNGKYFLMDSAIGNKYYFYFETTTAIDPAIPNRTGYKISISTNATSSQVALAIKDKLSILLQDFTATVLTNTVHVVNVSFGTTVDSSAGNSGFTVTITQQGRGEDLVNKTVLLSTNASPSIAVDETTRSLIRMINSNINESVYAFYLSGAFDVPGKMEIEARNLELTNQFYITTNNSTTGNSFNPAVSPDVQISSIGLGMNPIITTSTPHGLLNLDFAVIGNTNSTPSIDGVYEISYISSTQFSISFSAPVTVIGALGAMSRVVDVLTSENETKPNRIYYSKLYQPEAVPVTNYFDVGAQDKAIIRIMPLRDSLFVFKEDGLFRISGESSPFQLNLFDSSFTVTSPDSVAVSNNVIYAWTNQGIQNLTEGGASVVSRPIDNQVLRLGSNNYTNFKTATWGVGYESDNSYLVWTVNNFTDEIAMTGYRFSTLTKTWTTYNKTNTCGIIGADDKLYLGAGDTNYIEQERKLFDRTDFADREFDTSLANDFLVKTGEIKLASITGIEVGDVILQDQSITCFEFNTLLNKLDTDNGVAQTNFFSTLELKAGDNPRLKLLALAAKLDADTSIVSNNFLSQIADYNGTITSISGANPSIVTSIGHNLISGRKVLITGTNSSPTIDGDLVVTVIDGNTFSVPVSVKIPGTTGNFQTQGLDSDDLKLCYNKIIQTLNTDSSVSFNNYRLIDNNTIQETIITSVNQISKHLILNLDLQFLVGFVTIFKAIPSSFTYSPVSMGDPLNLKHLREATLMFQTRNITSLSLSFGTDLLPEFIPVIFKLDGSGTFGHSNFGDGFFGGTSNSAPVRTYIPRQCQRCRFIVVKYDHKIAREDYRLLGVSITGEIGQSTRAYR